MIRKTTIFAARKRTICRPCFFRLFRASFLRRKTSLSSSKITYFYRNCNTLFKNNCNNFTPRFRREDARRHAESSMQKKAPTGQRRPRGKKSPQMQKPPRANARGGCPFSGSDGITFRPGRRRWCCRHLRARRSRRVLPLRPRPRRLPGPLPFPCGRLRALRGASPSSLLW